jgi:hypothetical protein
MEKLERKKDKNELEYIYALFFISKNKYIYGV